MIQANALLYTAGKSPTSFVVLDLMRLPLGILSGMGFIGAGAILRKGDRIAGITTAATLWFVTVMGLCFGGGQLGLGSAALGLAIFILWVLKWVEQRMPQKSAWLAGPYPECQRSHGTGIPRAVRQGRLSAGVMRKVLFRRRTGARTSLQGELASATRSDRSANIRGRAGAPS